MDYTENNVLAENAISKLLNTISPPLQISCLFQCTAFMSCFNAFNSLIKYFTGYKSLINRYMEPDKYRKKPF